MIKPFDPSDDPVPGLRSLEHTKSSQVVGSRKYRLWRTVSERCAGDKRWRSGSPSRLSSFASASLTSKQYSNINSVGISRKKRPWMRLALLQLRRNRGAARHDHQVEDHIVVKGMVDHELHWTMQDLQILSEVSVEVSMTGQDTDKPCGSSDAHITSQRSVDTTPTADKDLYAGVSLSSVLGRAGCTLSKCGSRYLYFSGPSEEVARSFRGAGAYSTVCMPMHECLEAVIAYKKNGLLLQPEHGFPAYCIIPGGSPGHTVMQLSEIIVTDRNSHSGLPHFETTGISDTCPELYNTITDSVTADFAVSTKHSDSRCKAVIPAVAHLTAASRHDRRNSEESGDSGEDTAALAADFAHCTTADLRGNNTQFLAPVPAALSSLVFKTHVATLPISCSSLSIETSSMNSSSLRSTSCSSSLGLAIACPLLNVPSDTGKSVRGSGIGKASSISDDVKENSSHSEFSFVRRHYLPLTHGHHNRQQPQKKEENTKEEQVTADEEQSTAAREAETEDEGSDKEEFMMMPPPPGVEVCNSRRLSADSSAHMHGVDAYACGSDHSRTFTGELFYAGLCRRHVWQGQTMDLQQWMSSGEKSLPCQSREQHTAADVFLDPKKFKTASLLEKVAVSADCYLIRFAIDHPHQRLGISVGQHVLIRNIGITYSGTAELVTRAYSPITGDDTCGHFDIMVKVYRAGMHPMHPEGGKLSQMLEVLEAGSSVEVKGPFGTQFVYPSPCRFTHGCTDYSVARINMVAGGTGITPMYQVISAVLRNPADTTELRLVYANDSEEGILLRQELDAISAAHPKRFSVHYTVCEPAPGWAGSVGFVNGELFEKHLFEAGPGTVAVVCGPQPMLVHACHPNLSQLGFVKGLTCFEF